MDKKRIQRLGKGEEVVCEMLPEDMQEAFDKIGILHDDLERAYAELMENKKNKEMVEPLSKKVLEARNGYERQKLSFWEDCHKRYGYYSRDIGVRDGYSLVVFGKGFLAGGIDGFHRFMKDILGGGEIKPDGFEKESWED